MANWREVLRHAVDDVETAFDRLKYGLAYRLGGPDPIKIIPYNGYGTREKVFIKGRVLEDPNLVPAAENDSLWNNLVNTYKRLESDEIPHARLLARSNGVTKEIQADEEGMFEVWLEFESPLPPDRLWQEVTFELLEPLSPEQEVVPRATGKALIPPPSARFGVISDIDDTVIKMGVGHLLKVARTVFLGNAHTRLPFPGVAALYRALHQGAGEMPAHNPLFFVSSSPWNLYDLLVDFFHLHDIPNGPVLTLRNYGITEDEILPLNNRPYKLGAIRQMMGLYAELPFILIGDSSQEDPEIYAEAVEIYPERVLAIYIRDVSYEAERSSRIRELAEKVVAAGSSLLLAEDSVAIARHALERGWISPDTMPEIRGETAYDESPADPVEELLGEKP